MKEIQLTNGGVTLVDDEDFDDLNQHKWFAHKEGSTFYAWRNLHKSKKIIKMHRQILKPRDNKPIDHINGNGLDNQKANIRLCTGSQNLMNTRIRIDNSSGFKGVSFHKKNKKWRATINLNGKQISAGCYATPKEAAIAYNRKAIELFGEFARPNVI